MKTKEELDKIKDEYNELSKKLAQLTEQELQQVVGGEEMGYPEIIPVHH